MTTLPSRIGAVLFDMDNTLVDFEHAWFSATADLWRHAGSEPAGVGVLGGTVADVVQEFLDAHPDVDPAPVEARFMGFLHDRLADGVVTMPGAHELLTRLSATIPVAIASNSPSAIVRDTVAKMGWSELFTAAVGTEDVAAGRLKAGAVREATIQRYLYTHDMPDVDLFLRTSGEQRTSNFLPWQSTYAEMIFLPELWPDVDRRTLWKAVEEFAQRDRRYGGAVDAVAQKNATAQNSTSATK